MLYLALLAADPALDPTPGTPEWDADMALYARFDEIAGAAITGGEALEPGTATTVRAAADGPLVTDGPFAEGAEVIGGFFVLDVPTLDDAIELARQIPVAAYGSIELRPAVEWFQGEADRSQERYMALVIAPETAAEQPGTPEWDAGAAEHARFGEEAGTAITAGAALHPAATATTVRVRDGEVLVTDGPHAEGPEVVGGLYVFATPDRAGATALAAQVPVAPEGGIELQRVMEMDG